MMFRSYLPFVMSCWWLIALAIGQPITGINSSVAGLNELLPDLNYPESVIRQRVR